MTTSQTVTDDINQLVIEDRQGRIIQDSSVGAIVHLRTRSEEQVPREAGRDRSPLVGPNLGIQADCSSESSTRPSDCQLALPS